MTYGYVRVSSVTQNVERQLDEMMKFDLRKDQIFIDKQSGKDFDRRHYQILRKKLKKGDLLIIKSIDRLGRDYGMIIQEWHHIVKVIEADIMVIDMPLLDTRIEGSNLMGKFISDIVLQILSFVAQNERENIRLRQAEGIKLAKARGVHMGRPPIALPDSFDYVSNLYRSRLITCGEAAELLCVSRATFLKYHYLSGAKVIS